MFVVTRRGNDAIEIEEAQSRDIASGPNNVNACKIEAPTSR
jgi:hypothetical protein